MMKTNAKPFLILLLLSVVAVCGANRLLPCLPRDLCIGTTYAAYAVEQGYRSYPTFVSDTMRKQAVVPAPAAVSTVLVEPQAETDFASTLTTDAPTVQIKNETDAQIDTEALLENYTPPQKNTVQPQILIVHTHATEAFAECDNRSTDNTQNVTAVGELLAQKLTAYGFCVLHDKTHHDYPNYNGSYVNCLNTVSWYLKEYPSIEIVLDLHRDGIVDAAGNKVKLSTEYNGVAVAQMMFVVGTDCGGLNHPNWRENLKFAAGLQQTLLRICPTLMRPVNVRNERFNQHTTPNTVIVECGSNGNRLEEAKNAVCLLADALNAYIR